MPLPGLQQVTGGAYTPVVVVPQGVQNNARALRYHFTISEGRTPPTARFCADCGSRVTGAETTRRLPWLAITASSLDDPAGFAPVR